MNLLLIGLRGSGKSTFGRRLAQRLDRPFIDLDDLTPAELAEASVADAFTRHGEPAFRAAEVRALIKVLAIDNQVIALGGGTPTAPGAADLLRAGQASGTLKLIYLRASPQSLRRHLTGARNTHRPSLTGQDPLAEIEEVLAQRDGLYQTLANIVYQTDDRTKEQILTELERLAEKR